MQQARQDTFLSTLAESPIRSFPGVLELINASLAHEQLRVAIATSGTRTKSEAVLRSANIPYTRMAYVTGSDVAHRKPDPELFLTAASRIELPPELCVVIEDAPNGIQAALAAGCKCIAVTNACPRERLEKEAPDMIVDSLIKVTPETILRMASQ